MLPTSKTHLIASLQHLKCVLDRAERLAYLTHVIFLSISLAVWSPPPRGRLLLRDVEQSDQSSDLRRLPPVEAELGTIGGSRGSDHLERSDGINQHEVINEKLRRLVK